MPVLHPHSFLQPDTFAGLRVLLRCVTLTGGEGGG